MELLKSIKEALIGIALILGTVLFTAAPAIIGGYVTSQQEIVYKDYVVVDKLMNYTYSKSGQNQVLSFIVKDVWSGELESKDVSKVVHYKYNVGDSIQFEDYSKYSKTWLLVGLILSGLLVMVMAYVVLEG
jgi:hypothetical protein